MDGRRVVRGGIGCPVCHAEYPIVGGIVEFGEPASAPARQRADAPTPGPAATAPGYGAAALQAFINLQGGGGYALLIGGAARLGAEVAALHPGVHFFGVNAPAGLRPAADFSLLRSPQRLPVKAHSVRSVVLGADYAAEPWLSDGVRALLNGLRLVVEDEHAGPEGIVELARGAGVFVGEKRAR